MENKMAATVFFPLLFLTRVLGEESATPSSLLNPRNFNHHAFAAKYLQGLKSPEATKQGPVLFPNDAPPPPRPPLIVTSRPLIESIARSELNPTPQNNSLPQQSQINNVIKPFLARVKDYRPFAFVATPEPSYDYGLTGSGRNGYDDYEHQPALPPIYKVFADHAKQNVVKIQNQRNKDRYENKNHGPEYYNHRKTDDENSYNNDNDDKQNKNYAFSYRVKDQKTGDDFSHSQHSSGSATNGEYRVRLPDGRMQIVSYTADENGYQADVRYADDEVNDKKPVITNDYKPENPYKYNPNILDDNHDNLETNDIDVNDNHNSFHNNRNDYNDRSYYNDYSHNAYTEKPEYKNDYIQQRDYKTDDNDKYKTPVSNDYTNQYADLSKEYYNDDLSSEYESKSYDYAPHKSKFSSFNNDKNIKLSKIITPKADYVSGSTVRPTYEELKDLLVTKKAYNTVHPTYFPKIPVTINVPSTTPSSFAFEGTTERVVVIGGKKTNFYTNVRNVPLVSTPYPVSVTPSPINYVSHSDYSVSPTPMNYLASTIATLRNQVDFSGPKPILSNSYIDRINKYLRFN